jgi:hypothetical protein
LMPIWPISTRTEAGIHLSPEQDVSQTAFA